MSDEVKVTIIPPQPNPKRLTAKTKPGRGSRHAKQRAIRVWREKKEREEEEKASRIVKRAHQNAVREWKKKKEENSN